MSRSPSTSCCALTCLKRQPVRWCSTNPDRNVESARFFPNCQIVRTYDKLLHLEIQSGIPLIIDFFYFLFLPSTIETLENLVIGPTRFRFFIPAHTIAATHGRLSKQWLFDKQHQQDQRPNKYLAKSLRGRLHNWHFT